MVMKLQKIRSLQQAEFWVEEELECDRVLGWVTMTDTSLVRSGASNPEHRETRFKDQKISKKKSNFGNFVMSKKSTVSLPVASLSGLTESFLLKIVGLVIVFRASF